MSDVQRRQMTTVDAPNVFNIAIEGSFDDCQDIVKALFADTKFRDDVQMSAVNSINWARVLAQVVYYAHAASQLHAKTGSKVTFCVPTGNFGNVYAGYVARAMGAPIDRLIVATNSNDILHRFFDTGRMQAEKVTPTLSPSMDIQISSNFERLMFDLLDRNGEQVESLLQGFRKTGELQFGAEVRKKAQAIFASGRQDDAETLDVMRRMYAERKYLVDPHTAVGLGVAESYLVNEAYEGEGRSLVVSLATAHPAKFPDAVKQATGVMPELPPHLADLHDRKERFTVLPNDVARVKDFVKANAGQGKSAIRA